VLGRYLDIDSQFLPPPVQIVEDPGGSGRPYDVRITGPYSEPVETTGYAVHEGRRRLTLLVGHEEPDELVCFHVVRRRPFQVGPEVLVRSLKRRRVLPRREDRQLHPAPQIVWDHFNAVGVSPEEVLG